jgi:DNA-binding protein Fis
VIGVRRVALPAELSGRLTELTSRIASVAPEQRAAEANRIWGLTSTRGRVYGPLGDALRTMAPGREQCMYCGETGGQIDHWEPVSRNPLRTFDWLNHLLACAVCNGTKKGDRFPVDSDGQPLLIDPTAEDPFDHLLLTLAEGEYVPLTEKGEATIKVCDLNRTSLQRGRRTSRSVVETCLERWNTAWHASDAAKMREMVLTVREQPFADVCQSMLRQAQARQAEIIFGETPGVLGLLRMPELRNALLNLPERS